MLPIAVFVGRNADRLGRRPIFLVAFAVPPIRAALYTLSDNAFWLLSVQLLDGVGAGICEALTPLLIADVMRGTGRYIRRTARSRPRRRLAPRSAPWRRAK
jgi:MFS family permease